MQRRVRGYYVALACLIGLAIGGGRGERKTMSAITYRGTVGISAVMRSDGGDGTVNPPVEFSLLMNQLLVPGTDAGEIEFFYEKRHTAPGTLLLDFSDGTQLDKRGQAIEMTRVRFVAIKNNNPDSYRICTGGIINDTIGFSAALGAAEDPEITIHPGMVVGFIVPGNHITQQDFPTLQFTGPGLYPTDVTVWLAGIN